MTEGAWIALGSGIISASTFVYAVFFKTGNHRTETIERRMEMLEEKYRECEHERERLINENVTLMRRINELMDEKERYQRGNF